MARRACDGDGLLDAFRAAVANLEAHVDEINGLNVYPVPDGDTGSNMFATVKAALDEAEAVAGQPADRIAAAISFGALMGARGNSGVITSQIFRGMAEGLGGKRRFNGLDLAHALSEGARTAYSAVAKPVEGTILTVIRESAAAAVEAAEHDNDIEAVLGATLAGAETVRGQDAEPARDPARGRGRRRRRAGAVPPVPGRAAPPRRAGAGHDRPATRPPRDRSPRPWSPTPTRGSATRRCSCSRPSATSRSTSTRSATTSRRSASRCSSRATRGRSRSTSTTSGRTWSSAYGLGLGSLSRISVENLDNQARDVRETRAAAFTAERRRRTRPRRLGGEPGDAGRRRRPTAPTRRPSRSSRSTAGDGLAAIFRDFGVAAVVQGGQSANPSTGELLEAVKAVRRARGPAAPQQPERRPRRPPGRRR